MTPTCFFRDTACRWSRALPILSLCIGGFVRSGLTLSATASQTSESALASARLFRNPDAEVEVDSRGKGHLGTTQSSHSNVSVLEMRDGGLDAVGPQVENGDFELGSTTKDFQFATTVPGWNRIGDGAMFIKNGSDEFQKVRASRGNYLIGFSGQGSGVYQSVGGHIVGKWYRLIFHSAYSPKKGEAKLKVSVDATPKFNEAVKSGTLGWYEITYKAPYADVIITFEHSGPTGDFTVFLDGIHINPVELWNLEHGNSHSVVFQKVSCNGVKNPSADTCTRGKFLSVAGYDDDGATGVVETTAATENSVWVALHQNNRWSFKSGSLVQASTGTTGSTPRTGSMWYLHSDYNTCQARNWFSRATSSFEIELNHMHLHELSGDGTECGTLFAIQNFLNADAI